MPYACPAKRAAYGKQWRRRNRKQQQDYFHDLRQKPDRRAYMKKYALRYKWLRHYGLTPADVVAMKKAQRHRCGICNKKKRLWIDHCHKTGRVRGLLCPGCNSALGKFQDGRLFKAALKYLKE